MTQFSSQFKKSTQNISERKKKKEERSKYVLQIHYVSPVQHKKKRIYLEGIKFKDLHQEN